MEKHTNGLSLLPTKFYPSLPGKGHLSRTRHQTWYRRWKESKLTMVLAPAGYGKSMLLGEWFCHLTQKGDNTAWLSLDENDNNPNHFLKYLLGAFEKVQPNLGQQARQSLTSGEISMFQPLLNSLVQDLAEFEKPIVLFLDDLHTITEPTVLNLVDYVLRYAPNNVHFVMASRTRPELSLNLYKSQGQLLEYQAPSLRFDLNETINFLNKCRGLQLDQAEYQQLYHRTEGWPASLQLISLALTRHSQPKKFIQEFSGNDRDISGYLHEVVFGQQPKKMQDFLLKISILERMCDSLCREVVGIAETQLYLEKIESMGLFLIPLDREHHWYRLHPLFRDFLKKYFQVKSKGEFLKTHQKASQWFKKNNWIKQAIDHALVGKDFAQAAQWMVEHGEEFVCEKGMHSTWLHWMEQLPPSYLQDYPLLRIFHANALLFIRRFSECETELRTLEGFFEKWNREEENPSPLEMELLKSMASMTQALLLGYQDRIVECGKHCQAWLQQWGDLELGPDCVLYYVLGASHLLSHDYEKAQAACLKSREIAQRNKLGYGIVWSVVFLGSLWVIRGHLNEALQLYQETLKTRDAQTIYPIYTVPMLSLQLAEAYYEKGELTQAKAYLEEGTIALDQFSQMDMILKFFRIRARLSASQGEFQLAETTLKEGEAIGAQYQWPRLKLELQAERILLYLRHGKTSEALHLAQQSGLAQNSLEELPQGVAEIISETSQFIKMRLCLAQGQLKAALNLVANLLHQEKKRQRTGHQIQLLLSQALCFLKLGKENSAQQSLETALQLGTKQEFVQIFVEEGKPIQSLLQQKFVKTSNSTHVTPRGYLKKILNNFLSYEDQSRTQEVTVKIQKEDSLREPLTKREQEIITLLDSDCSVEDLAAKLFISKNTLKTHLRHLYTKLGVRSRSGLVSQARKLGFLS